MVRLTNCETADSYESIGLYETYKPAETYVLYNLYVSLTGMVEGLQLVFDGLKEAGGEAAIDDTVV